MMDEMYKAIIYDKTWKFKYDGLELGVNVKRREAEHYVKCTYRSTGKNYKQAFASIFRFLNEVVWFYDAKIDEVGGIHSEGDHVGMNYNVNSDGYLFSFKQRVFDEPQHLALAFFREAECNESPYYRFLSYAKILEIPFLKKKSVEKVKWIDTSLNVLKGNLAVNFRDRKINSLGNRSLGEWLHQDGRHAIAHGRRDRGDIVRDPNNYDDWEDIKWANTIMHELAEMLIIGNLGVAPREGIPS